MFRTRKSSLTLGSLLAAFFVLAAPSVEARILSVGPGKTFSVPCHAFTASVDGDTVEIDAAGTYSGDTCTLYSSNLIIRGVNGRPKIDAAGRYSQGKGTWVVAGNNVTIENVEMMGAAVPDRNGAAVRLDGRDLTLRKVYFHHNENGLLTANDYVTNLVIENSEFAFNGDGSGYSHNLYVGHVNSLVFRGNYSHDANVGHDLKTRAQTNTIAYNRFSSTEGGRPSYEIDIPNAGTSYVIGNIIQQPAGNSNPNILAYGEEGASNNGQDLYVVNNTFLNDDSSNGAFIMVGGSVSTPALVQNNIFAGTGNAISQWNAIDRNNYRGTSPAFVDRNGWDLRPTAGSPLANAGAAADNAPSGVSLVASLQYAHIAGTASRPNDGAIDIGAYEAATATSTQNPDSTSSNPVSTTSPFTSTAPVTSSPTDTSTNWVPCANEWGVCNFSGTRQVRFGVNGQYVYKTVTGPVSCTNDVFGDPAVGYAKNCAYAVVTSSLSSETPTANANWTFCANEWASCNFTGSAQVRFGANGQYVYKTVTGPVSCTNDVFGDPAVGVAKNCSYAPVQSTVSWTGCASESGICSFSGAMRVRYGANGSYVYQVATGSIGCNNAIFGDPVYGIAKSCDYAPLDSVTNTSLDATMPAITVTPSVTWADCSAQWSFCGFSGTRQVRYGVPGKYVYKSFSNGVACTNDMFGDPAVGDTTKSCAYAM
ncbi:right-handed parallel beta-helix repeat-containing protein [Noviherbaspirillum pedocola]|uniref:Right handed beta helix domain-containing protein n=1 Tax=Noviherbaspirillum pedocola TaxID=2801341 RepID=A0A934SYX0_9BURK|nr:hypothetical protein [Noviherbaspirillum pedocola]MBK4737571.1 hypothetical protein [Noviherbaspirillum pedocola]